MSKFKNFLNSIKSFFNGVKDKLIKGYNWLGADGIINMETSALLMIAFMTLLPIFWSAILKFIIVVGKCALDKSRGRENEKHDLICSVVGILFGVILGTVHAVVVLL